MNEKVKNYLEERRQSVKKEEQKKRDVLLLELGLYEEEKVFADPKIESRQYPYAEYDKETDNYYYVKKVAISVSDDEFEEIRKFSQENTESAENEAISEGKERGLKNWGTFLIVLGIIFIVVGIIVAIKSYQMGWYAFFIGLLGLITCLFNSAFIKVIANISARLDEINRKLEK